MKVIDTSIPDVKIIEPAVFGDERGFFMETWNHKKFEELVTGKPISFVQDNHSKSSRGVLRGMHYQLAPYEQGKLVRCVKGAVYDVAVDVRRPSKTFGNWVGVKLTSENKRQLWIPEGFAHGFVTLVDETEFLYKTTNYYMPEYERGIQWNDKNLGVEWPESIVKDIILSKKDKEQPSFKEAEYL